MTTVGDRVRCHGKRCIIASEPEDNWFGQYLLNPLDGSGQIVAYEEELEPDYVKLDLREKP